MTDFFYLIPVALLMGAVGLGAFLWSLRSGQYEDLDGAAERILFDEDDALMTAERSSPKEEDIVADAKIAVSTGTPSK